MNKPNKDIQLGDVNLTEEDLDIKNSKIRITTMVDFTVLEQLKKEAKEMGIGYQTLINIVLTRYANGASKETDRVDIKLGREPSPISKVSIKSLRNSSNATSHSNREPYEMWPSSFHFSNRPSDNGKSWGELLIHFSDGLNEEALEKLSRILKEEKKSKA